MKHLNKIRVFTFVLMLMAGGLCSTAKAQTAEIVEPDTTAADLMYLVAADNSLKALPMEDGKMEKHKNKFGKLASIVSYRDDCGSRKLFLGSRSSWCPGDGNGCQCGQSRRCRQHVSRS